MNVQMIENWSDIHGIVVACQESLELDEFHLVSVLIDSVSPVEGYTNLFSGINGMNMDIFIPSHLVLGLHIQPDLFIECRVRRATHGRIFVHQEHIHLFEFPGSEDANL
jgi:hypothetical protein